MILLIVLAAIIIALVIALGITQLQNYKESKKPILPDTPQAVTAPVDNRPSDCCGAHEVCESDTLLSSSDEIEYYNDEELDRFRFYKEEQYTEADIEEFREVLYTLLEREVANWMKSLQLRQITPPAIIREEALMIVADRRFRENS